MSEEHYLLKAAPVAEKTVSVPLPPLHAYTLPVVHRKQSLTPAVPWKGISLAVALLVVGSSLIIVGSLILTGYMAFAHMDMVSPHAVIVIGILILLPGTYYIVVAFNAFRGISGYSFEDIPNFD